MSFQQEALDKIILGTARSPLVNEKERLVVAYHEAGHAIVGHYSEGSDPLRKISIVPRGRALGVVIQTPDEDRYNYSRTYLLSRMATAMGGRAAEELIFDEMTTGAQNDIKEATTLARRMVGLWGMTRGDRAGLPRQWRGACLPRPRDRPARSGRRAHPGPGGCRKGSGACGAA
ncbi:MAG: hypothetical protein R3A46_09070 [Thermomicrobiales bacterium]